MVALIGRPAEIPVAKNIQTLAEGNTIFALNLYARLKATDGNLFFSPYSISTCLAMTYAGARGGTAAQMAQTLHFSTNQSQFATAFGELQKQLTKHVHGTGGIALDVANGLWCKQGHPFLPAFVDLAKQSYEASLNQVDFCTQSASARTDINDWVRGKTKGKITGLIQPGVLGPMTRLVLVNAIYFKGHWAGEFEKSNTLPAPFAVSSTQKVTVPLMSRTAEYKYAEADGLQLLELPYAGGDLSMVVLLPHETDGLKGIEDQLNEVTLERWLARAQTRKVAVFLPRFKLTAQFSLAQPLAQMGMTDAFTTSADFSGMDGARDLYISAVVHKAFVEVNEAGTEAAAATGVAMRSSVMMMPRPTPVFRADHPFVFLIRDNHSGSILFLGRLVDPARS